MSSRIARALIRVAVAAAIAPFNISAIGSAVAQKSATQFAAQDCLTNRYDAPVSETDGAIRRTARAPRSGSRDRAVGDHGLSRQFCPSSAAPRGLVSRFRSSH